MNVASLNHGIFSGRQQPSLKKEVIGERSHLLSITTLRSLLTISARLPNAQALAATQTRQKAYSRGTARAVSDQGQNLHVAAEGYGIIDAMVMLWNKTLLFLRMIKIAHSVFALPFAFTGALLAASGIPSVRQLLLITIAMVGARSGAMGLNRIIDREIDAANPRTRQREIPSGKIRVREAVVFTLISFAILVFAAYHLNPLCLRLAPIAILILIIYSYTKRFTWASHFILGLAISGAPLGAWIAIRGTFDAEIIPLSVAVVFWLSGFDVLYALQDLEFDRSHGLYSIPRRFGLKRAILLSRIFHFISFSLLITSGLLFHLGPAYWAGMLVVGGLLVYEHSLVRADDLRRLDMAFFNMNGYISITVFVFTLLAVVT